MPEIMAFRHFDVTVIRSDRRRSATIKVDKSGVSFRVPNDIKHQKIAELVEKKTPWIRKKLEYAASLTTRPLLDFEDGDQYKEEQKDLMEDKIAEMEGIKKNEEDFAIADNELAKEMAETAANIPDPPPGDLGTIAPPAGYGKAYTPGLVK